MKAKMTAGLLVLALVLSSGCASVRKGSSKVQEQALTFTPPPGKANVYLVRTYNYVGCALLYEVGLDWQPFGSLAVETYLFAVIPPGKHILRSTNNSVVLGDLTFEAEEGKNYYFKVGVGMGGSLKMYRLDEETGKKLVQKFQLSGDSVVEFKGVER